MSDKEKSTVICHRCRWGATPGHLTQCNNPDIMIAFNTPIGVNRGIRGIESPDRDKQVNPAKWALPSIAAASGSCDFFAPVEVAG